MGDSSNSSFSSDEGKLGVRSRRAGSQELFAFPKPPLALPLSVSMLALQIAVTFAIVLGVIIYRISTAAALAMNSSPSVRSNIRVTVTATAVIINLVVIILLDEVYGCIARWLTKIGECCVQDKHRQHGPGGRASLEAGILVTELWPVPAPPGLACL